MISGRVFILNNHRINEKAVVRQDNRLMLRNMIYTAMFAALTAVCSQIQLPIGAVPFTLQTMGIFIAAGLLGAKKGTLSVGIYILLGAVGIPVFAGFSGGLGIIAGPTGGYIIGYIVCAAVSALLLGILCRDEAYTYPKIILSLAAGLFFCYLLGTIWFYIISGWTIGKILMACVVVFLPGDALKIAAAAILIKKVKPQVSRYL